MLIVKILRISCDIYFNYLATSDRSMQSPTIPDMTSRAAKISLINAAAAIIMAKNRTTDNSVFILYLQLLTGLTSVHHNLLFG